VFLGLATHFPVHNTGTVLNVTFGHKPMLGIETDDNGVAHRANCCFRSFSGNHFHSIGIGSHD
jgi:hypothetical protein